jgi:hypothetical protein
VLIGDGWVGAVYTITVPPVVGVIDRRSWLDPEMGGRWRVEHVARVDIEGHNGTGTARVEADDPATLRALAYVCGQSRRRTGAGLGARGEVIDSKDANWRHPGPVALVHSNLTPTSEKP